MMMPRAHGACELWRFSPAENTQKSLHACFQSPPAAAAQRKKYILYTFTIYFSAAICVREGASAALPRRPLDQHSMYSFSFTLTSMSGQSVGGEIKFPIHWWCAFSRQEINPQVWHAPLCKLGERAERVYTKGVRMTRSQTNPPSMRTCTRLKLCHYSQ